MAGSSGQTSNTISLPRAVSVSKAAFVSSSPRAALIKSCPLGIFSGRGVSTIARLGHGLCSCKDAWSVTIFCCRTNSREGLLSSGGTVCHGSQTTAAPPSSTTVLASWRPTLPYPTIPRQPPCRTSAIRPRAAKTDSTYSVTALALAPGAEANLMPRAAKYSVSICSTPAVAEPTKVTGDAASSGSVTEVTDLTKSTSASAR